LRGDGRCKSCHERLSFQAREIGISKENTDIGVAAAHARSTMLDPKRKFDRRIRPAKCLEFRDDPADRKGVRQRKAYFALAILLANRGGSTPQFQIWELKAFEAPATGVRQAQPRTVTLEQVLTHEGRKGLNSPGESSGAERTAFRCSAETWGAGCCDKSFDLF
jgi:hypothetical protein